MVLALVVRGTATACDHCIKLAVHENVVFWHDTLIPRDVPDKLGHGIGACAYVD